MRIFMIALLFGALTACSVTETDVKTNQERCASRDGVASFQFQPNDDYRISELYCTIDGVRYTFSRTWNTYYGARATGY